MSNENKCLFCGKVVPEGIIVCPVCGAYKPKKENKYHATKIQADGMVFDSRKEYQRWCELKLLLKAGRISDLKRQVRYTVIPKQTDSHGNAVKPCEYIADFVYIDNDLKRTVVEDVKGYKRGPAYEVFKIKKKLMLRVHGIDVQEA